MSAAPLYTERAGSGEPLVLLHGWAMNLRVFDELRTELAAHYRIIAIDLPGHGHSAWPPACTPARQLELIGACVPAGATLVGWSLGGQLALELALARAADPARAVRALVLIASTPRFVAAPDWPHGLPAGTLARFAQALQVDAAGTVADFLELQVRGSRNAAATAAALRAALTRHGMAQAPALRADLALLANTDLRERTRALPVPALLIAGEYDRITPPAAARALATLLPRAALCEVPRAGHAPFLSHTALVSAAVLRFLRGEPVGVCAGDAAGVADALSGVSGGAA